MNKLDIVFEYMMDGMWLISIEIDNWLIQLSDLIIANHNNNVFTIIIIDDCENEYVNKIECGCIHVINQLFFTFIWISLISTFLDTVKHVDMTDLCISRMNTQYKIIIHHYRSRYCISFIYQFQSNFIIYIIHIHQMVYQQYNMIYQSHEW